MVLSRCLGATGIGVPATDTPPVLDGKLNDACWDSAAPVTAFHLLKGEPPPARTEAHLCRDGVWLYIAFRCHEPTPSLLVRKQTERDGPVNQDDSVEIFVDLGIDGLAFYHFMISTDNVRVDQRCLPGGHAYRHWNDGWRSATAIHDTAWCAEVALPLCRFQRRDALQWRINLTRNKRTHPPQFLSAAPVKSKYKEVDHFLPLEPILTDKAPFAPVIERANVRPFELRDGQWGYELKVQADNQTPTGGELALCITDRPAEGASKTVEAVLKLGASQRNIVKVWVPAVRAADRVQVEVAMYDPRTGEQRQRVQVRDLSPLRPMTAYLDRNYYTSESAALAVCSLHVPTEALQGWRITARSDRARPPLTWTGLKSGEQQLPLPLRELVEGTYAVELVLHDPDGHQLSQCALTLHKRAAAADEVKLDRQSQVVLVNREPFFPMGLLGVEAVHVAECARAGFNTVSSFGLPYKGGETTPTDVIDAAQAAGVKVIEYLPRYLIDEKGDRVASSRRRFKPAFMTNFRASMARELPGIVDRFRQYPSLLAYYSIDEPALSEMTACQELYAATHRADPYHPMMVLFSGLVHKEPGWRSAMDLVGADVYPIMSGDARETRALLKTAWFVSEARALADRERTALWILPLSEFSSKSERPLLPDEHRAQAYLCLIYGAKGLIYYRHPVRHQATWDALSRLAGEVSVLAPALLRREPAQEVTVEPRSATRFGFPAIHARIFDGGADRLVMLVANSECQPMNASFSLSGVGPTASTRRMFGENPVRMRAGMFSDALERYGTRAYEISGCTRRADDPLNLHITVSGAAVTALNAISPSGNRNLLANGDFESEGGWQAQRVGGHRDQPMTVTYTKRLRAGGQCVRIARTHTACAEGVLSDWLTLKPRTRYRYGVEMMGKLRPSGKHENIRLSIRQRSPTPAPKMPSVVFRPKDERWHPFSRTVVTGDAATDVRVWMGLYACAGEAWFDNVYLHELGSVSTSRNLIANSSFEQATLAGWPDLWWTLAAVRPRIGQPTAAWTQDTTVAYHGRSSMRITNRPGKTRRTYSDRRSIESSYRHLAKPGVTYTFSVYLKADRDGRRVKLYWRGNPSKTLEVTTEWKRYWMTGQYESKTYWGKPEPVCATFYCLDQGTVWADAVQVEIGGKPAPYEPDVFSVMEQ